MRSHETRPFWLRREAALRGCLAVAVGSQQAQLRCPGSPRPGEPPKGHATSRRVDYDTLPQNGCCRATLGLPGTCLESGG
jgi:hypothetical protein